MVCGKEAMISGCSSYSKVFLGCTCVCLSLLCAALFFIFKGVLGLPLRGLPCFMQTCSSYSKVFWGCSCVRLSLPYAALFFIFKGVF